jgi:uncharacterized SAM-binding protein YcdF (DUF218 family)
MFYILSKTIDILAMPINIACFIFLVAFFVKNQKKSRRFILLGLLWIYIFSCPIFVNWVVKQWESTPKHINDVKNYEVGVVLTGGISKAYSASTDQSWLGWTFDRAGQAFQLYKAGKIKKIVISGGMGMFLRGDKNNNESLAARSYLIKSGVPASDIILEPNSVNTRENAVETAKVLRTQFKTNECLLITSAFHLPRASGCFRKAGVVFETYPSAFLQQHETIWIDRFFPNETSFHYASIVWHEWLGYVTYRLVGYI